MDSKFYPTSRSNLLLALPAVLVLAVGCSNTHTGLYGTGGGSFSVNSASIPGTGDSPIGTSAGGGAGMGSSVSGTGALSVPTSSGIVARLQVGMQNNVSASSGNFSKALTTIQGNLPKVTNPSKATGFDQVQLLAYAACTDLSKVMQTKYNVVPANTVLSNQSVLIAAGVKMLDQYAGGLASQGPTAAQVTTAFSNLVSQIAATASNTSTIAFVSVCVAANTTGSVMLGF